MTQSPPPSDDRLLESALAFWRDAGLDVLVEDVAVDRLHKPEPVRAPTNSVTPIRAHQTQPKFDAAAAANIAAEAAKAAPDLNRLIEAIEAFEHCPLRDLGARQAVIYRGRPQAPVMLIGEAPGADEDRQGQPFVGRAGKLLNAMLKSINLQDRVFITNTVFWRPPGNRTPTFAEQSTCAPFVERMIELVDPQLLVFVGGAAAKFMLKTDEGALKLRGQWREWNATSSEQTRPALSLLHPAYLLRQPQAKADAWRDLLSLSNRLESLNQTSLET